MVLSIAGFDPCGGAGVLADIQTTQQCKVQGMAVVSALTSQNEDQVFRVTWQDFKSISNQLESLLDRYSFEVAKIGIIENLETLESVIDLLMHHSNEIKIIWDPILKSSSGFDFLEDLRPDQLNSVLKELFLITPNLPEYERLKTALGNQKIETNILLKGGHADGNDTSDLLIEQGGNEEIISGQRIKGEGKHGTGCVLSSAIASGLNKGMKLKTACTFGKRYVEGYLKSGYSKLGAHYEIQI
ncbi:hydroxymethylpyrimidine/phosphomethylpyrimidine kinase [Reichenbachiella sp.]